MEVTQAVRQRYSCRSYKDTPVDAKVLRELFDIARLAPSASNRQEWRFVAVTDRAIIETLTQKAGSQGWWKSAPAILACCADTNYHVMSCRQHCYPIDVSIIMDQLSLLATERGLATCWVGAFDEDVVKETLGIPRHVRVVELMTLGYPADGPREKKRLGVDEILYVNSWGKS
jgi:nitroreductase